MDPSSVRDAGMPVRGDVLVIVLIGALAVALSFVASPDLRGVFGAALALLMLAIAVSDIRHFIIPDAVSATAFILGLFFAALFDDAPLSDAVLMCLLRATAAALPLLALMLLYEWWRGRPGLGLGDVKLAAVAGAWLDWFTIVGVIEVAALAALTAYGVLALCAAPAGRGNDAIAVRAVPGAGDLGRLARRGSAGALPVLISLRIGGRLLLAARLPRQGFHARLSKLAERHFGPHRIAHSGAIVGGLFGRGGRGEDQPLFGLDDVHRHPLPLVIEQAQFVLRPGMPLLGGAPVPDRGLGVILRHAAAYCVEITEIGLRGRIAVLRQRTENGQGRGIILARHGGDALAQRRCGRCRAECRHG